MKTKTIKPILFSSEMIKAILEKRKTQTRRLCVDWDQHKAKYIISSQGMYGDKYPKPAKYMAHFRYPESSTDSCGIVAPIQPGDILWVRESFLNIDKLRDFSIFQNFSEKFIYKADNIFIGCNKWKPSIHMPKEAARIFLKVTNVYCERLSDISDEDVKAEGIVIIPDYYWKDGALNYMYGEDNKSFSREYFFIDGNYGIGTGALANHNGLVASFLSLFAKIHSWELVEKNPWVWKYEFEVIDKPENFK